MNEGGLVLNETGVIVSKAATGRLTVSFPYNQKHIAKVKIIPGYKWYIRNASTDPSWEYICNADVNELGDSGHKKVNHE